MAKMEGDWTKQHRNVIERLERELGREICGVPTSSGLPCKEWPISQNHGRCNRHRPRPSRETTPPAQEGARGRQPSPGDSPSASTPPPSDSGRTRSTGVSRRNLVSLGLVMTAVLLGVGSVVYFFPALPVPTLRSNAEEDSAPAAKAEVQPASSASTLNPALAKIDPRDPDFAALYSTYREDGNPRQLLAVLDEIIQVSSDRSDRAEALYRKFVLLQIMNRFERSIEVADRYLKQFKQGSHRPEVLYGAGWISETYLNQPDRSRSYYRRLKDEFPESKWAHTVSSRT